MDFLKFKVFGFVQWTVLSEKEKLIIARHSEMEIPFLYQVKRGVLGPRAFADFDGVNCPDIIQKIRYDRRFVCFFVGKTKNF